MQPDTLPRHSMPDLDNHPGLGLTLENITPNGNICFIQVGIPFIQKKMGHILLRNDFTKCLQNLLPR